MRIQVGALGGKEIALNLPIPTATSAANQTLLHSIHVTWRTANTLSMGPN